MQFLMKLLHAFHLRTCIGDNHHIVTEHTDHSKIEQSHGNERMLSKLIDFVGQRMDKHMPHNGAMMELENELESPADSDITADLQAASKSAKDELEVSHSPTLSGLSKDVCAALSKQGDRYSSEYQTKISDFSDRFENQVKAANVAYGNSATQAKSKSDEKAVADQAAAATPLTATDVGSRAGALKAASRDLPAQGFTQKFEGDELLAQELAEAGVSLAELRAFHAETTQTIQAIFTADDNEFKCAPQLPAEMLQLEDNEPAQPATEQKQILANTAAAQELFLGGVAIKKARERAAALTDYLVKRREALTTLRDKQFAKAKNEDRLKEVEEALTGVDNAESLRKIIDTFRKFQPPETKLEVSASFKSIADLELSTPLLSEIFKPDELFEN